MRQTKSGGDKDQPLGRTRTDPSTASWCDPIGRTYVPPYFTFGLFLATLFGMSEDRAPTSIIVPVWNGASVLPECLRAVYDHSGPDLPEVIAVDNASTDGSADLIAQDFPAVNLIRQPFNLGFAGGVNAGIEAAGGDLFVLLNQDCIVEPGWLAALQAGLLSDPTAAIAGATIFDAGGALNHAGAVIQMPLAFSRHLTTITDRPQRMDCVTGAVFAIRRTAWVDLGALDDEFYPAYYEETDYCYRARCRGLSVLYVPAAPRSPFAEQPCLAGRPAAPLGPAASLPLPFCG